MLFKCCDSDLRQWKRRNRPFDVRYEFLISPRTLLRWICALLFLLFSPLFTGSLSARTKGELVTRDPDYVSALSAANRFLFAWQVNDQETGILMLTDKMKQRTREEALSTFFSSTGASSQSFEIGRGRRLVPGRYKFPVTLFQKMGNPGKPTKPRTSVLVVVHAGRDDWAIDRLP